MSPSPPWHWLREAACKWGSLVVEADEILRAEHTGGGLDPQSLVALCIWMRRTRMPGGDPCHTHTHASRMLRAHSRMPAHTHARALFWRARTAPCPLGSPLQRWPWQTSPRRPQTEEPGGVFTRLKERVRYSHPPRLPAGTCAARRGA